MRKKSNLELFTPKLHKANYDYYDSPSWVRICSEMPTPKEVLRMEFLSSPIAELDDWHRFYSRNVGYIANVLLDHVDGNSADLQTLILSYKTKDNWDLYDWELMCVLAAKEIVK